MRATVYCLEDRSDTVNVFGENIKCPARSRSFILEEKIRLYYILKYDVEHGQNPIKNFVTYSDLLSFVGDQNSNDPSVSGPGGDLFRSEHAMIEQRLEGSRSGETNVLLTTKLDETNQRREDCVAGDFLVWYYNNSLQNSVGMPTRLDDFVSVRHDWSEPSKCAFIVQEDPGQAQPGPEQASLTGWKRLRDAIDRDNEIFVYNVDPRNYLQRISTSAQADQDAVAFGAAGRAGVSGEIGQAAAAWQGRQGRTALEIEDHPLILPVLEGNSSTGRGGRSPYAISFGWVIAPKVLPGSAGLMQVDGTYSLSAVVSMPSWWRTLRAQYVMCWLDYEKIDKKIDAMETQRWTAESIDSLCPRVTPDAPAAPIKDNNRKVIVRLPHVPPQISAKLGFDTLDGPRLAEQQGVSPLVAGFPGDLSLEGERLWRSPSVFLNSQKADRIEVRPDMRGIVAHFNCVLPAPHLANGIVTVVTSEGSDRMAEPVEIVIPTLDDGRLTGARMARSPEGAKWRCGAEQAQTSSIPGASDV